MELSKHIENSFIDAIKDKRFTDAESIITKALQELNVSISIYCYIVEKNGKAYIVYHFNDIGDGSLNKVIIDTSIDSLIPHMDKTIRRIEIGSVAINKLNGLLKESRIAKDGEINIQYKWGVNKYSIISDWDYRNIKIKLSDMALDSLINAYNQDKDLGEISGVINKYDWNNNLIEFIKSFNDFELHRKISVTLKDYDITKILNDNMFNTNDILEMIKSNSNTTTGKQKFKSVFIVNELGLFAAILNWVVDYSKKEINVTIQDEKVIDLENARFVSDHSIYSRIERRAIISDDIKNSIFIDESISKTLEI